MAALEVIYMLIFLISTGYAMCVSVCLSLSVRLGVGALTSVFKYVSVHSPVCMFVTACEHLCMCLFVCLCLIIFPKTQYNYTLSTYSKKIDGININLKYTLYLLIIFHPPTINAGIWRAHSEETWSQVERSLKLSVGVNMIKNHYLLVRK